MEQSGEMSNAGGALPWSIQQRSHTPPSPDVDPRTYTRTTAGSVCAPSRHSCLSIPSPICLHAPLLCRPIERIHHWYSRPRHQRLLWCRSSSATVLLRLPRSESECMPIAKEPHHAGSRGQTSHMQLESRPSPRFKISSGQFSFWPNQCIATRL